MSSGPVHNLFCLGLEEKNMSVGLWNLGLNQSSLTSYLG